MMIMWLVTIQVTVRVLVDERGLIIEAAPMVKRFCGQPVNNLVAWMRKRFGPVTTECTFNVEETHHQ